MLEYGSVIWSGAADTHLSRLESIQHKFMVWLCCRCRLTDVPLRYDALERRFSLEPLSKRRQQHDLMFVRNVHRHCIDSAYLLEHMPLAVPVRNTRRHALFHVPYARVNTVKRGLFVRIPELCNGFLDTNRETDVWSTSAAEWRGAVRKCVWTNHRAIYCKVSNSVRDCYLVIGLSSSKFCQNFGLKCLCLHNW